MPDPLAGVVALAAVHPAELLAFAAVGVLAGAHCLGMCGPLVTLYVDRLDRSDAAPAGGTDPGPATDGGTAATVVEGPAAGLPSRVDPVVARQQVAFNLGRTVGYAAIGALLGGVGALTYRTAGLLAMGDGVRAAAGILAGVVVLAMGVRYLAGGTPGTHLPGVDRVAAAVTGQLAGGDGAWVRPPRVALVGAAHGLLPCPVLYPAFLYALATGSPVRGGLALGALGLGTIPTMLAYGTALGSLDAATRRRLHRALGAAFIVLALVPLSHGLALAGLPVPMVPLPAPW